MQFNFNNNSTVATQQAPSPAQSLIFGANGAPLVVETKPAAASDLPEGTVHIRVLASCTGKNFKAKHEETKSGQLLVTLQRIVSGGKIQYMDDMDQVHDIPAHLLPPVSQAGAYLELGERVHEIIAQISQEAYLGRGLNGSEPNRSMIFDVLISSKGEDVTINRSGKLVFLKVLEFGNYTRNTGIRQSAEEAFAALEEANSYSADIRSSRRAAAMQNLMAAGSGLDQQTSSTSTTSASSAPVEEDPWLLA